MRKDLLTLLAVTLLIGGCTHEETDGQDTLEYGDKPVTFMAAASEMTRGTAIQKGALTTDATFRVYATRQLKDNGDGTPGPELAFINIGGSPGNVVSYQQIDGRWVWKTANDYYWPQDNYLVNFYAIHPATAPAIADILTDKSFSYTESNPIDGDHDLMYAQVTTSLGSDNFKDVNDKGTAALTFYHAFAQIAFYGKLSEQFANFGWTLEVKDITICNVNAAGTFSFATKAVTPAVTPVLKDYTVAMSTATTVASTSATRLASDVKLLMPQTVAVWDSSTEITASGEPQTTSGYLTMNIRAIDSDKKYPLQADGDFVTIYAPFGSPDGGWQADTAYKYTVAFGAGSTVTAEITPWEDVVKEEQKKLYPE